MKSCSSQMQRGVAGCTVKRFPKRSDQPGETGTIKVRYDFPNRIGNFNKQVTVTASDGSKHVLTIEGEVLEKKDKTGVPLIQC